jgi:hypothetical protein
VRPSQRKRAVFPRQRIPLASTPRRTSSAISRTTSPRSSTISTVTRSSSGRSNRIGSESSSPSPFGENSVRKKTRSTTGVSLFSLCVTTNAPAVAITSRPNTARTRSADGTAG